MRNKILTAGAVLAMTTGIIVGSNALAPNAEAPTGQVVAEDGNNGHGNDPGKFDPSNPGKGHGKGRDKGVETPAPAEPTDPPVESGEAGSEAPADYTDPLTGDEFVWADLDNSGDEKDAEPAPEPTPIDWPEVIGKEPASDTGCADPALDAPDGSGCIPQPEPGPIYEDDPAWNCVTMGNHKCGAFTSPLVPGRTFVIEFNEAGEPVAVTEGF